MTEQSAGTALPSFSIKLVLKVLVVLALAALMYPINDPWLSAQGDWNYMTLQSVMHRDLSHGTDLLFMRGPLTFLVFPKIALGGADYFLAVAFHILSNVFLVAAFWFFFRKHLKTVFAVVALLLVIAVGWPQISFGLYASRWLMPIIIGMYLVLQSASTVKTKLVTAIMALVVAVHLLLIFSHGLMLFASFLAFLFFLLIRRRWVEILVGVSTFLVAMKLLWMGNAGVDPSFINYLKANWLVSDSYCEVASLGIDDPWEWVLLLGVFSWAALFIHFLIRRTWKGLEYLVLMTPILFYLYKHGCVRNTEVTVYETIIMWAVALGLALCIKHKEEGGGSAKRSGLMTAVHGSTLAMTILGLVMMLQLFKQEIFFAFGMTSRAPAVLLHDAVLSVKAEARAQELAVNLEEIRADYPMPAEWLETIGTNAIVVLPQHITVMEAYGLNWTVPPSVFSYLAWYPYLDDADLQYYTEKGPAFIMWIPSTIDDQNEVWFQPATLRYIRRSYEVVGTSDGMTLFSRRHHELKEVERVVEEGRIHISETLNVPDCEPGESLFLYLDVDRTLAGELMGKFSRVAPVHIELVSAKPDESKAYRFVRSAAGRGMLLSNHMFKEFFVTHKSGDDEGIESIRLSLSGLSRYCLAEKLHYKFMAVKVQPAVVR